jgi:hypothetical protein
MSLAGRTFSKRAAVLAAILAAGAAYAANPEADEKIAVAKAALQRAEQSGAPQAAPVELATARDKIARAEKAAADRDYKIVDAQVAEATATQQHSHTAATEFDASMQTLRNESMRNAQPNPQGQQ